MSITTPPPPPLPPPSPGPNHAELWLHPPPPNRTPPRRFPSMFEPIHGSAFDIMGKGIANPVATFWTASLMLEHLGEPAAARRLMRAVDRVTADPALHTPDLSGKATTRMVTDAASNATLADNE